MATVPPASTTTADTARAAQAAQQAQAATPPAAVVRAKAPLATEPGTPIAAPDGVSAQPKTIVLPQPGKIHFGETMSVSQTVSAARLLGITGLTSATNPSIEDRLYVQHRLIIAQEVLGMQITGKFDGDTQQALAEALQDPARFKDLKPAAGEDLVAAFLSLHHEVEVTDANRVSYGQRLTHALQPDAKGHIDFASANAILRDANRELGSAHTSHARRAEISRQLVPLLPDIVSKTENRGLLRRILDAIENAFGATPGDQKVLADTASRASEKIATLRVKEVLGERVRINDAVFNDLTSPRATQVFHAYEQRRAELVTQWQKAPPNSPEAAAIADQIATLDASATTFKNAIGRDNATLTGAADTLDKASAAAAKAMPKLAAGALQPLGSAWQLSAKDLAAAKGSAVADESIDAAAAQLGRYQSERAPLVARFKAVPPKSPEVAVLKQQIAALDAEAGEIVTRIQQWNEPGTGQPKDSEALATATAELARVADEMRVQASGVETPHDAVELWLALHPGFAKAAAAASAPPKSEEQIQRLLEEHFKARGEIPLTRQGVTVGADSFSLPSAADARAMLEDFVPPALSDADSARIAAFAKAPKAVVCATTGWAQSQARYEAAFHSDGFKVAVSPEVNEPTTFALSGIPTAGRFNVALFETVVGEFLREPAAAGQSVRPEPLTNAEIFSSPELVRAWHQWQSGETVILPTHLTFGGTVAALAQLDVPDATASTIATTPTAPAQWAAPLSAVAAITTGEIDATKLPSPAQVQRLEKALGIDCHGDQQLAWNVAVTLQQGILASGKSVGKHKVDGIWGPDTQTLGFDKMSPAQRDALVAQAKALNAAAYPTAPA